MLSNIGASWRAWAVRAMWLFAAAYVAALALHGAGWGPAWEGWFGTFVDGWLGMLTVWAPAAVCWLAVSRVGRRRPEVLLAAAAVTSYAAGDTYYILMTSGGGSLPFPSPADVAYLLVYPLLLAALTVTVRRQARGVAASVWLDCTVGSLGAAAVLAVVLAPVLDSATADPWSLATAAAVAPPVFDLVLVAAVAGIAALRGVRMGRRWAPLICGLLVFAATDVVYGLEVTAETYVQGTPLDAGWAIGLALMAFWVDGATQGRGTATQAPRSATRTISLAVSSGATLAGLGVLLLGTLVPISTVAVALAGVTLLAAAARSELAVRLLARMAEQRLLTATTDELTGLPNRRALTAEAQARLAVPGGRRQALLVLDLDKFKEVNDSLGHHVGDQLLVRVGARLSPQLRDGDLLARLGSDEFAVLLDDAGLDEAVAGAVRLRAALDEPFALQNIALHSSVSIGIALFPDDGSDLNVLLSKADIAMYKAKTSLPGHHAYCIADDADDATRLQTVEELRTALTTGQLVMYYQPKIDLDTGDVHSVEALVRWNHPTRGLLCPDAFLALVEEFGLMPSLTQVVLEMALDQVVVWAAQNRPMTVAVNLSASSLIDDNLPEHVTAMLAARGVPPSGLQLEITEEFLMADRDRARSILARLRDSGVQISVDDYGTGYSSLSYLLDLPIDELKLDQSFVSVMADDARAAALVASTIALAHSLDLRIVAEGVETDVVYTELKRLGCDQAQGYLMSRPLSAVALDHWLNHRPAAQPSTDTPDSYSCEPVPGYSRDLNRPPATLN
jgi:diguanylate cyclase (GGDEF)-like protein